MGFPRSGHLGGSGASPQKIFKFEAVLGAFWGASETIMPANYITL